jgi:hypothetical protein
MIPVYFPHTYIPETIMAGVHACFSPVAVYQPSRRATPSVMDEWEQKGLIKLHAPHAGDGDRLALLLKDFRQWAALHGGQHRTGFDYFRSRIGKVPFFDETSVAQIRADIKDFETSGMSAAGTRFFNARIFLSIAQEMDLETESLVMDLRRHDQIQQKLFSELTGNAASAPQPTGPVATRAMDQLDYMIRERLMAWWLLADGVAEQAAKNLSGIFVTASRSVVDHIIDLATDAVRIFSVEGIPGSGNRSQTLSAWRRAILDRLQLLVQSDQALEAATAIDWPTIPENDGALHQVTLTVFLIPGESPEVFFHKTIGRRTSADQDQASAARPKNTVVALTEIR